MPDGKIVHGWVYREHWGGTRDGSGGYGWHGRYLTAFFHSITDETISYAETDVEKLWVSIQHVRHVTWRVVEKGLCFSSRAMSRAMHKACGIALG